MLRPCTAGDQAYRAIREMASRGEFAPGQRLSQRALARRLGCSTVPVLEAMRRLESDGFLISAPHCIAKVRELSDEEMDALYLVRESMEAVAARMAASRIEPDQLARLGTLSRQFDEAKAARDCGGMGLADVDFHKMVAQAAHCGLLAEEIGRLMLIEKTAGAPEPAVAGIASAHSGHQAIVAAIGDGDAAAAEYFMRRHIQSGHADRRRVCAPHGVHE